MILSRMSFLSVMVVLFALALGGYPGGALAEAAGGDCNQVAASACGKCGDGYCAKQCGETAASCPADCGVESLARSCGKCGDGVCVKQCGENESTCPADCGGATEIADVLAAVAGSK